MTAIRIPMVDLAAERLWLKDELDAALLRVADSCQFILGPECEALEREIAAYLNMRHALAVSSGTEALHLALRAAGIGPGDEVITTPFTFIATAEAIAYVGAKPVFVDVDAATLNIDPALVAAAITKKTRAVLPVHLYGRCADLTALSALCNQHHLLLIEDCAQSFGARSNLGERQSGSVGLAGCFSFYPSKNLGAFGDGGLVATNDEKLAARIRSLRNHGSARRYFHDEVGYNARLDDFQAAVLRVKFKRIEEINGLRRSRAERYCRQLAPLTSKGLTLPPLEANPAHHVWHQFTLKSAWRNDIARELSSAGIANAIYYPVPLHLQQAFAKANEGVQLPVSEQAAKEVLSLPISPLLTDAQIDEITAVIAHALH